MPAARIPRSVPHGKPKPNFRKRVHHLAFVRQLPCVACGKAAPSHAAKQHRVGELTFWSALRFDPLNVALRLWTVSADVKAGERTVFRARQQIDLAKTYG
jgi:hypothetical protein